MKEHILDLIIVENNKDHFKIWDDYFSKKFKIKVLNRLENCLESKNIFNKDTIFIIHISQQKSHYHKKDYLLKLKHKATHSKIFLLVLNHEQFLEVFLELKI